MSYYSDGTVSFVNGNAHVHATGTVFVAQAAVGDLLVHGGYSGTIKQVISSTELLLEEGWAGAAGWGWEEEGQAWAAAAWAAAGWA